MRRTVAAAVSAVAWTLAGCSSNAPSAQGTTAASTSSQASSNKAAFSMFTGLWSGHGNTMQVSADGSFTMYRRVYAWCNSSPPPCDSIDPSGNITDGAIAHGVLKSVSGTVAIAIITTSTDTALFPTGSLSFDLDVSNDLISAFDLDWCGPSAPADKCGL
jgi:hypothetical protein